MQIKMLSKNLMLALALGLGLSACTPSIATRGNLISDTKLSQVRPHISTAADVITAWGPPTATASFDPNTWYYIGEQTVTKGILAHDVAKRRVVRVMLDDSGTVSDIAELDTSEAAKINIVERKTSTAGKEFTAIQQMIGNVGRFSGQGARGRAGP